MSSLSVSSATAWLVVTATIFVSCGGGGGHGGEAIAIDDLPAAYQEAACERRVLCRASPDLTTCGATVFLAGNQVVLTLVQTVERGTTLYDGAAMRSCLDEVGRDCLVALNPPLACRQAFQGQLPAGSACVTSEECAGDADCERSCAGDTCCAGICVPRVPLGGDCAERPCTEGAFCDQGVCAEYLPLGASCTGFNGCAAPGVCEIPAGATSGMCVISSADGIACDPARTFPCGRLDERCEPTVNRCMKVTPVGGACTGDRDCVLYARCVQGSCAALPAAGAPCEATTTTACQGTLACASGTCAAPAAQPPCAPLK